MNNSIVRVLASVATMLAFTACLNDEKAPTPAAQPSVIKFSLLTINKEKSGDSDDTIVKSEKKEELSEFDRIEAELAEQKANTPTGAVRPHVISPASTTSTTFVAAGPVVPASRVAAALLSPQPARGGQVAGQKQRFTLRVPYYSNPMNGKDVTVTDHKNLGSADAVARDMQKNFWYLTDQGMLHCFVKEGHPQRQGHARR